jgi:alcohol dehydrogenase, propanol-preferring
VPLDAAIICAPAGSLVPAALRSTAKGGSVVCTGIHMRAIPALPYELLWHERVVRSVANLARRDGEEFFALAAQDKSARSLSCCSRCCSESYQALEERCARF